jgi:hypothetical protein
MKRFMLPTLAIFTALLLSGAVLQAKSLYVISNIWGNPTPVQAYDLIGSTMVYQTTYGVPKYAGGAVGIAIDSDNEILFVTYENSNVIQVVNAKTMTGVGSVTAPGAFNLAGIVYDHDNGTVYAVDRNTKKLYVYVWNPVTLALTLEAGSPHSLSQLNAAYGIALDESADQLYIGDLTTNIKIFNTADWSYAGYKTVGQSVMGVTLDAANGYLYTGNAYPGYGSLGLLCKYDLNTETASSIDIRAVTGSSSDNVVGLAVDPATGLLYITTGNQGTGGSDRLMVFNSSLVNLGSTGDIGDPTGVAVPGKNISYNPLDLTVSDGLDYSTGECVQRGGLLTYSIGYDNLINNYAVTNVTITVTLDPLLTWVSGGTHSAGVVAWNIGTLAANDPGGTVTLVVDVSSTAALGGDIDQLVGIVGDQTGPSTVTEKTLVCLNQPPTAICNNLEVVADANCEGYATPEAIGYGSSDPDADPLTYAANPAAPYPLGETIVTLSVTDGNYTSTCSATVTVVDQTPPVITFVSAPITLWPPNHDYATVSVSDFVSSVSDNCDARLVVSDVHIVRVESDEEENANGNGDGNTLADMVIASGCEAVDLRKERAGSDNGRVYRIWVRLYDDADNYVESFFDIMVKHDPDQSAALWDGVEWSVSCGAAKASTEPLPAVCTLEQNFPNPFNPVTSIGYAIPETGHVLLTVHDIHGRVVRTLFDGASSAGLHTASFDARTLPSGLYVYRMEWNGQVLVRRMALLK